MWFHTKYRGKSLDSFKLGKVMNQDLCFVCFLFPGRLVQLMGSVSPPGIKPMNPDVEVWNPKTGLSRNYPQDLLLKDNCFKGLLRLLSKRASIKIKEGILWQSNG